MNTSFLDLKKNPEYSLRKSIEYVRNGEIIVFPTETVYGMGCLMSDTRAVKKIYEIKSRPPEKPLSAYISKIENVDKLCSDIPDEFYMLAQQFLPGPLTIVLKKRPNVHSLVTAGLDTLAIRIPDNEFILKLLDILGEPIAATSANISGKKAVIDPGLALKQFNGQVAAVIDGGTSNLGKETTIISLVASPPLLLRKGPIEPGLIEDIIGRKLLFKI